MSMSVRAGRRVTVKGLGQDRSPIRRKSVGDVSCISSPNDLFPLSAVAPDPHLRLTGCCLASTRLASSLDPRPDPSALLCPSSGRHLHPCGPPPPRQHPMFFRRSPFHIARGRFWDQFRFCVLYHRLGSLRLSLYVAPIPSVSMLPRSHISSTPNTFFPLTAPFQTIPYGLVVPWFIRPVSLVSPMPSTCRLSELPVV